MAQMIRTTFFLDQGETLGGSERFLLDFLSALSETELQKTRPILVGGELPAYQSLLPENVVHEPFQFPSLKGSFPRKIIAGVALVLAALRLKKLLKKQAKRTEAQIFANTPRTILVGWIAKILGSRARFIVMIHDFTIPKFFLTRIGKKANVIIANSVPTRNFLHQNLRKTDTGKIKIVENGINFQKIPAEKRPESIRKILLLGRIDPRKGQLFALRAAEILSEQNPELDFFLVGDSFSGDPATIRYEKEIETFLKTRNLKNVYRLPGVDDPFSVMRSADLILALSTEPETFGRIVIEGLSLGKPVLAFDQTGPREILQEFMKFCQSKFSKNSADFSAQGVETLLVEANNAKSLADKIEFFANHREALEIYTNSAREFVNKHYSLAETKKRLVTILQEKA